MTLLRLGAIIVLLAVAVSPVAGQTEISDSTAASEELKGIRSALDRLVRLHEAGQQYREMDLLIKRIELRERRLGPLQERLHKAETNLRREEDTLEGLEKMFEQQETRLEEEIRDGVDVPRSETRNLLDEIRRTRDMIEDRIEDATGRLRQLEDEVAEQHEEIEILDDMLTELLGRTGAASP